MKCCRVLAGIAAGRGGDVLLLWPAIVDVGVGVSMVGRDAVDVVMRAWRAW